MNRRRFLKYAGATVAVVGASALGLDYILNRPRIPSPQINETLIPLSSSLATASVSSSSSTPLVSLQGRLFYDYNGNGKQDNDEPPVQNAQVIIADAIDTTQVIEKTFTDSSGDYTVDIPAGNYQLFIKPDTTNPKNPVFRYMCQSDAYITDISDGYPLNVVGPGNFDVGLMEGFATLPFPKGVPIYVDTEDGLDYFNHDCGFNAIYWNGQTEPGPRFHTPEYANPATDFSMPEGTEVKAALPGIVSNIYMKTGEPYLITLRHLDSWGTTYVHILKPTVQVGAFVKRGDTIALSSDTGVGRPGHYHTAFQLWKEMNDGSLYYVDPYSPVNGVPKGAWIAPCSPCNTVIYGGNWTWHPQGENEEWVSEGYWTKLNDPQYPDSL